jgi:hypothetical protein
MGATGELTRAFRFSIGLVGEVSERALLAQLARRGESRGDVAVQHARCGDQRNQLRCIQRTQ